ncbi:MAG: PDZ domain-containing protein, partial [Campylobacteraceae bacterium]|nr:PDZ domain-containing protein [Campylobacteraceae bacterium]
FIVPQNEERALEKGTWLSSVDRDGKTNIGKLESLGKDLGEFDSLSTSSPKGTIITGVCCDMYGLGKGGKSFIGNRYLEHIVAYDFVYYGDIGASFKVSDGKIKIVEIDPFLSTNLRIGDELTHLEKKLIKDIRTLNEAILFAPKDSKINLQVVRGKQSFSLEATVKSRSLTPMATRTYLEPLGMSFDKELRLKNVNNNSKAKSQGLEIGDRLLQIGQASVKTPESLRTLLPTLERGVTHHMLFERSGFQFFVTLVLPML